MTEGGADFPLVTMSTVFQPSTLLSYHLPRTSYRYAVNLVVQHFQLSQILHQERVLNIPSIWCCNVIIIFTMLFTTRVLHAVNLESQQLSTCIILERVFIAVNQNYRMLYHLSYSRYECRLRRQSELSITVIGTFNAQNDTNFNV